MSVSILQRVRPLFVQTARQQYTPSQRLYTIGMARSFSSFIVSPQELQEELGKNTSKSSPRAIPVSAEWFLPNDGRNGYQEFLKLRVPGARFFDLDAIKDPVSPYPHMVPTASVFAEAMRNLGISRDDTVSFVMSSYARYILNGGRWLSMTAQHLVSSLHQEQRGPSRFLVIPKFIF